MFERLEIDVLSDADQNKRLKALCVCVCVCLHAQAHFALFM